MGSLWRYLLTRTRRKAWNKEYARLFLEEHGVQGGLARFIEFSFYDQQGDYLNSRTSGVWGRLWGMCCTYHRWRGRRGNCRKHWWFSRTKSSIIPPWISSVLFFNMLNRRWCATCLGERSWTNLKLVILRYHPHTYSCTCLYSKKTKVETRRDSTGFNTGESKLYWIKEHYYMEH